MHAYSTRQDVSVLADYLEVPGLGFLPVNAFVIHAALSGRRQADGLRSSSTPAWACPGATSSPPWPR